MPQHRVHLGAKLRIDEALRIEERIGSRGRRLARPIGFELALVIEPLLALAQIFADRHAVLGTRLGRSRLARFGRVFGRGRRRRRRGLVAGRGRCGKRLLDERCVLRFVLEA
ncbi:MAG: hypothetical protein JOZ30_18595 [Hyphomicrobiales bacterium]|nr:hypothetical protein [Hyphomicrobiales bacterium]